jgi:hypothetical protein
MKRKKERREMVLRMPGKWLAAHSFRSCVSSHGFYSDDGLAVGDGYSRHAGIKVAGVLHFCGFLTVVL